jgi:hypothetical protein
MGKETACEAISGKTAGPVKAHLDSERLRLSGTLRRSFALGDLRAVEVRGDTLHFEAAGERIALGLGAKTAAAWARAIAHPKTLLEKLDLKRNQRICVLGFDDAFSDDVAKVTLVAPATALRGSFDAIFCALSDAGDLKLIAKMRKHMVPGAALWLVSQKGKDAPLHENVVRAALLDAGLVDTKVVSFSATHTACKAVIPVAQRAKTT